MVIVFDGVKGALQKESFVKSVYDALLTASSSPFRNTGQGVCFCGKCKCLKHVHVAKATSP